METWLVQSVAGLLYGDGTCRQSDFSAAEDNGSYNTAAVDYGVPSADSYKFNASDWVLPDKNEAALRDVTRQRGSGHGYYFSAE